MVSRRRRQRRIRLWRAYQHRLDLLTTNQHDAADGAPVRVNPGFFRAEGWNTGPSSSLRHGA